VFAITNAQGTFVTGLRVFAWGYSSIGGPAYAPYVALVLFDFVLAIGLLVRTYITTTDSRMRLQVRFWLLGLVVALPLGVTNLLSNYGIHFYPLGNLGSAAWVAIVGYAIARHRLLDIDVFLTKTVAYIGVIILLVGPVFTLTLVLQYWAFGELHYGFSAELAIILVGVGILFSRLLTITKAALERSLFRDKYESRVAMTALAGDVVRILERETLIEALCVRLVDGFRLEGITMWLLKDSVNRFEIERFVGARPLTGAYPAHLPFIEWLQKRGGAILREEAEEEGGRQSQVSETFRRNNWVVCVPFVSNGRLIGFLGVGAKRDREAFTSGDLKLLDSIATEATIALENARLYEEVRRSRDIINRTGRMSAIGTLAAGIAHEIRNPLVSIHTFFQLAPDRLGEEEFVTSFLPLARAEVERISRLIAELLSFAKSPTPSLGEIEIDDVVSRALTLLEPQAHSHGVELRRTGCVEMPSLIGDADQVLQVLVNLLLNGIQATARGGRVDVDIQQVEEDGRTYCRIEVRDTGSGIPIGVRDAIFNPFFTTKEKGTGLGLAIAHQIVTENGGFISVESVEGRGSSFLVYLPVPTALPLAASK
jgi:signal transduction histidine kinase